MEILTISLFWVFVIASLVNVLFWVLLFSKLAFYSNKVSKSGNNDLTPHNVSVIICARNEVENLQKNLPRILNQSYRSLELVLVNDQSNDNSGRVMQHFQENCSTFRIIIISNTNKKYIGKKEALAKGIQASSNEIVLLTDADCWPKSENWVFEMQQLIQGKKEIGLGYSPYKKRPGFLNRFIRFETVYTAIQYLSFALARIPYMGVGRNLIYKKALFNKAGGFDSHKTIASGDDDLFINSVANSENVAINISPESFVYSMPPDTWEKYYKQKARHMSTGVRYKRIHQVLLGILALSHFLHYMGGIVLIILNFSTIFVLTSYVLRISVVVFFYDRILNKLQDKSLLRWIPMLDFLYVFYYMIFANTLNTGNKRKWK